MTPSLIHQRFLIAAALCCLANGSMAQSMDAAKDSGAPKPWYLKDREIESNVIHNYDQVHLGFSVSPNPVNGSDAIALGFVAGASSEIYHGLIVGVDGGSAWGRDRQNNLGNGYSWGISPSVSYVFRIMDNRINFLPRVVFNHSELGVADVSGSADSLGGGFTLSYAFTSRVAFAASYLYAGVLSGEAYLRGTMVNVNAYPASTVSFGPTFALTESLGLFVRGSVRIADADLPLEATTGAAIGIEWHW